MAEPFAASKEMTARLAKAGNARIQIGVMGQYGAAQRGNLDDPDATVLDVAYLAEYGRSGDDGGPVVPAREPLRTTFTREKDDWRRAWAHLTQRYIQTGKARRSLAGLASVGFESVRTTYAAGMSPPLSEFTLQRRRHGGDVPFVDTGATMRSNLAEIVNFEGDVVVVGREVG